MTNENVLKLLNEMNVKDFDYITRKAYNELIKGVKDNIRTAANKAVGKNSLAKNAKAIIKNAKRGVNCTLHGAWIDKNGKQYVCDNFRILEINEPIELPTIPKEIEKAKTILRHIK